MDNFDQYRNEYMLLVDFMNGIHSKGNTVDNRYYVSLNERENS